MLPLLTGDWSVRSTVNLSILFSKRQLYIDERTRKNQWHKEKNMMRSKNPEWYPEQRTFGKSLKRRKGKIDVYRMCHLSTIAEIKKEKGKSSYIWVTITTSSEIFLSCFLYIKEQYMGILSAFFPRKWRTHRGSIKIIITVPSLIFVIITYKSKSPSLFVGHDILKFCNIDAWSEKVLFP